MMGLFFPAREHGKNWRIFGERGRTANISVKRGKPRRRGKALKSFRRRPATMGQQWIAGREAGRVI